MTYSRQIRHEPPPIKSGEAHDVSFGKVIRSGGWYNSTVPRGRADVKMARMLLSVVVLAGAGVAARAQQAGEGSTILSPMALQEIARVEAEIDATEVATLARLAGT